MGNFMTINNFNWKEGLADLFAGSVNQQTLEEAAELMVSISAVDASYHLECLTMLDQGISAAEAGDNAIINCINKSGYQVASTLAAAKLLEDFRKIYLKEYERARY
jgi:hypothetical protein